MLKSRSNQSKIISLLVSHHPTLLCEKNRAGFIPLHIALNSFNYQSINVLMPDNDGNPIESARHSLAICDSMGRHAFHYASQSGLTTFIERYSKFIDKTIINQQDSLGLTPLHYSWYVLIDILRLKND
jgi:ankyrin repeat protein